MADDHSASRRIDVLLAEAPHLVADEFDVRQQTRSRDGFRLCEQVKVKLSPEMKRQVQETAARQRRTDSAIVRTALREYFARQAKSKGTTK